jgi:hypothetical protein
MARRAGCALIVAPRVVVRFAFAAVRDQRLIEGSEVAVVAALVAAEMHSQMHERDHPAAGDRM